MSNIENAGWSMGKVIRLEAGGIEPALATALDDMQDGIWDAIDRAADQGMPIGLIIGQLEMIKAALISAHIRNNGG